MVSFNLLAEVANQGYSYCVTVDELANLARLNVEMKADNPKKTSLPENSQGVDLTADECEALGKHLIAVSERLRRVKTKRIR
jgi:hypothetical protein